MRVNLRSEDPLKTARIKSLRIDLAPPLALEAAGELAVLSEQGMTRLVDDLDVDPEDYRTPTDVDPLEPHVFSYFIRAFRTRSGRHIGELRFPGAAHRHTAAPRSCAAFASDRCPWNPCLRHSTPAFS